MEGKIPKAQSESYRERERAVLFYIYIPALNGYYYIYISNISNTLVKFSDFLFMRICMSNVVASSMYVGTIVPKKNLVRFGKCNSITKLKLKSY